MYLLTLDSLSCIYSLYMANTNMSKGLKYILEGKGYEWQIIRHLLIWCACIFVDSLSKKRERDANLHHVHITLKSLICASYKHVLISPNKNHTLKDEIIISAQ